MAAGSDARKVALARLVWEGTTVSQQWIADELGMSSAANVSQQIRYFPYFRDPYFSMRRVASARPRMGPEPLRRERGQRTRWRFASGMGRLAPCRFPSSTGSAACASM